MAIGTSQTVKVTLEFAYEAQIFPGDPEDAFEIANLEMNSISPDIFDAVHDLNLDHLGEISLTVLPVLA